MRQLQSTVVSRRVVHRTWLAPVLKAAARLLFLAPYDLGLVSVNLDYWPSTARVDCIVSAAHSDMPLMDLKDFNQIVTAQLLLQHLRVQKPFPHRISIGEMLDVFVGGVDARLSCTHPFVREAVLATLNLGMPYPEFLQIEIGDDVPFLQRYWRRSLHDHFCIAALVDIFHQGYIQVMSAWRLIIQSTPLV